MPELPEVETIRRSLSQSLVGKIVKEVEILEPKMFIGAVHDIVMKKIIDVTRVGKVLTFKLSNDKYISIHLKLTGQLLYAEDRSHAIYPNEIPLSYSKQMPGKTTHVIIDFTDGSALFFNDLRKFGWMKVLDLAEEPKGTDILSPDFTLNYFEEVVGKSRKPIKVLLMDQDKMSGIGNIYANDSLHLAGVHPTRIASSLGPLEVKKLYDAIITTIDQGIKYRGSSSHDEMFVVPDGTKGQYQNHFRVYRMEGKTCKVCGAQIERIKQAGRSSFFCPVCQPKNPDKSPTLF